jgi:hypothetical protein
LPDSMASRPRQRSAKDELMDYYDTVPVEKAPALTTINGFGFKLYGRSELDPDNDSYMTTHYLTLMFIPVLPLARYRVIRDEDSYAFVGKGKLRTFDKVHMGVFALLLLWFYLANRSK